MGNNNNKYAQKLYKLDHVIHETTYYEIFENCKSIHTTINRLYAYQFLSYKRHEHPKNNYRLYKHICQHLKTTPKETI